MHRCDHLWQYFNNNNYYLERMSKINNLETFFHDNVPEEIFSFTTFTIGKYYLTHA